MAKAISPIPAGFRSLTTHLAVSNAAKYIDFLKKALGAEVISGSPGPGGKLMHAQVCIGDSILMFADDFGAKFSMATQPGRKPSPPGVKSPCLLETSSGATATV